MQLQSNERKELISCLNERIKSRADLIDEVIEFFGDLKPSDRVWEIRIDIGKYGIVQIEKSGDRKKVRYHKHLTWLNNINKKSEYDKYELNRKLDIELHKVDKNGYKIYSDYKHYHELDYRDLVEFVANLDNILVNIALIDDCKVAAPIFDNKIKTVD